MITTVLTEPDVVPLERLRPTLGAGQPADPADGRTPDVFEALSQEHEALLAFLYSAPVGLVQTDLGGQVALINAMTATLLMPTSLQYGVGLGNLFDLLAPLVPDLRQRVAALGSRVGMVCDDLRLPLSQPGEPQRVASLRLVKLDQRRLAASITDITRQVQDEQAREQAEARLRFAVKAARLGEQPMVSERRVDASGPPPTGHVETLLARAQRGERLSVRQGLEAALRETDALHQRLRDLEADNRRLQEGSRLMRQFVATVSHELRSPLTSIIGFAELLRGGIVPPGSAEHRECLARIVGNGQHLLGLINDMLDLAKVEAGKLDFKPGPLALPALASDVREAMAPLWQRKQQSLVLAIGAGLDNLYLDAARLRQVLYNLISNAIKFTPEGGRVVLSAQALAGAEFVLEVADTGVGIAEADLPRLFSEFQQVDGDAGRAREGTGLGLSLTRRLVLAQGGQISVRSTLGEGSVFSVRLPRVQHAS